MGTAVRSSYRSLLKPAGLTSGAALLAFGVLHALTLTPLVTEEGEAGFLWRLGRMFVIPVGIGVPFALVAASVGAAVWRVAHGGSLSSWRYGAALATGLLPVVVFVAWVGPVEGDDLLSLVVPPAILALPALVGFGATRRWHGLLLGPAALPFALPWSGFILSEGLHGRVIVFVAMLFAIVVTSGWMMERLVARASRAVAADAPAS